MNILNADLHQIHEFTPNFLKLFKNILSVDMCQGTVVEIAAYDDPPDNKVFIFQGAKKNGRPSIECFAVFDSVNTAIYFVAENYIQPKVESLMKGIYFTKVDGIDEGPILRELNANGGILEDLIFSQFPYMSNSPYGYVNTQASKEEVIEDLKSKTKLQAYYSKIDFAFSEDPDDLHECELYILQINLTVASKFFEVAL